jgi:hypothetical protein
MNALPPMSGINRYALQLIAVASDPARVAGRLEHVLSGRLHDFDDGRALLALLAREQSQGYSTESADPDTGARPSLPASIRSLDHEPNR